MFLAYISLTKIIIITKIIVDTIMSFEVKLFVCGEEKKKIFKYSSLEEMLIDVELKVNKIKSH